MRGIQAGTSSSKRPPPGRNRHPRRRRPPPRRAPPATRGSGTSSSSMRGHESPRAIETVRFRARDTLRRGSTASRRAAVRRTTRPPCAAEPSASLSTTTTSKAGVPGPSRAEPLEQPSERAAAAGTSRCRCSPAPARRCVAGRDRRADGPGAAGRVARRAGRAARPAALAAARSRQGSAVTVPRQVYFLTRRSRARRPICRTRSRSPARAWSRSARPRASCGAISRSGVSSSPRISAVWGCRVATTASPLAR